MSKSTGKKFLSDLKLYSDYLKWKPELNRYETWDEACEDIIDGHRKKFSGIDLEHEFESALESMKEMRVFASQRSLQFRAPQLERSNLRMFNCLGGETRFITNKGVFSFEELGDNAEVLVWTHKGRWMPAKVKNYGKQRLNKICFSLGTHGKTVDVRATSNHRWILNSGKETTNLKIGDSLIRPIPLFNFEYESSNPLQKLYWCYGYVYGDGTKIMNKYGVHKHSMVRLCGHQIKFEERFNEMGFKSSSPLSIKGDIIAYTGKYLKTLPDINKDNLDMIQAFVCGYLDADGAKKSDNCNIYIGIQSSNEESIEFIKNIFPTCGIFISKEYDLTGQETNFGIRPKTSNFSIRAAVTGNNSFKVRDIIEDNYEDVWCLEVEEDNSFTLESGIVTGNCSVVHAVKNTVFQEVFYLGLNGCGVGISLLIPFVQNLSNIEKRIKGTKTFVVPDTIEGWSDALGVLMSSYLVNNQPFPEYAGYEIKFDYSLIRPKGSFLSGGFKAPGPDGLKLSLDKIETLIENWISKNGNVIRPILVYDIICHASDAVLSGSVRRSALIMLLDHNDEEMIKAKTGNWRQDNPQRARSNNSVIIHREDNDRAFFDKAIGINDGDSDLGFLFVNSWLDITNPCGEIVFTPVNTNEDVTAVGYHNLYTWVKNNIDLFGVQMCNLTSMNAEKITSKEIFLKSCKDASFLGTLQASYTNFPYLSKSSENITNKEALLGVSMTGWMNNPKMFDPELLIAGSNMVKETNRKISNKISINPAARTTCCKPEGNLSVIAGTSSGVHPEHSERYFRIMQLNKGTEVAKWVDEHMPFLLEESVWSASKTDFVVFVPIVNPKDGLFKNDMKGVKHLELIKLIQENWVMNGTNKEFGISDNINHNVSATVIIDDQKQICDFIWDNKNIFTGVSFISDYGDKDFNQAPFTSVLTFEEIMTQYGKGALFASGLIVDGLHYFNQNLWQACDCVLDKTIPVGGNREQALLRKSWLDRAKKFSRNYFKGDLKKTVYCLKDIHLFHKWESISRQLKEVDFSKILLAPEYKDVSDFAAIACSGPQGCSLDRI